MLVPFTKKDGGTVFIRAEDIRRLEDIEQRAEGVQPYSRLHFVQGEVTDFLTLQGTALEIFQALAEEEQRRAEEHYRRQAAAQAGLPVARGRPR